MIMTLLNRKKELEEALFRDRAALRLERDPDAGKRLKVALRRTTSKWRGVLKDLALQHERQKARNGFFAGLRKKKKSSSPRGPQGGARTMSHRGVPAVEA